MASVTGGNLSLELTPEARNRIRLSNGYELYNTTLAPGADRIHSQGGSSTSTPPNTPADPMNRDYILSQLKTLYGTYGAAPGARGSGATDAEYYADEILKTGGWTDKTARGENNVGYWTDKIGKDLQSHGYAPGTAPGAGGTPTGTTATPTAGTVLGGAAGARSGRTDNTTSTGGIPGFGWLHSLPGLGWTQNIPGAPLGRDTPAPGNASSFDAAGIAAAAHAAADAVRAASDRAAVLPYLNASAAAGRQRGKGSGTGRSATILGGFTSGTPATRASVLGGY
jgi:hypothetical protein